MKRARAIVGLAVAVLLSGCASAQLTFGSVASGTFPRSSYTISSGAK